MKRNFELFIITSILIGLFGFSAISLAQHVPKGGKWKRKADMSRPRSGFSTVVINGKIYAIGGEHRRENGAPLFSVEAYDPATDTWTQITNLPEARYHHASSVVDGKIYVFGGNGVIWRRGQPIHKIFSTLDVYNPATNTWEQKADMLTARSVPSTAVANGKIYAVGGWAAGGQAIVPINNLVEVYDPAVDKWTQKREMPTRRMWLGTAVVNGKIYAIGGESEEPRILGTVEEYNPAFDVWTKKASMPTERRGLSTGAVNDKIYAVGGRRIDNLG